MPYYAFALLAFLLYTLSKSAYALYQNVRLARASGIPYTISPVYGYNRLWLITAAFWIRLCRYLPSYLTESWIDIVDGDWSWHMSYTPFSSAMLNTDTFLIVSPGRIIMVTAEADVISQMTTRKNDFPKPIEIYQSLDIFGKNVVSVEGGEWRRQRRLLTPQFNEKSNAVVWKESLFQAGEMLESWSRGGQEENEKSSRQGGVVIGELGKDAMRLSLHVISRAGFDVRCLWPGAKPSKEDLDEGSMDSNVVPKGHQMSYTTSLETLLHRIIAVLILPDWLLKYSPFALLRDARTAYKEWGVYMDEIYDRKADTIQTTKSVSSEEDGLDLMGAMIRHSGLIAGTANHGKQGAGMSQSEVMGNSFVLFLAGHETAANSIHFCVLFLAMRPELQKKLQAELTSIFGDTPPSTWSYDAHIATLFSTLTGAIMSEQLRLIPPVVMIPKSTAPHSPQHLRVNGKDCTVPADTYIALDAVAVHRNKKYWPHGKPREGEAPVHPTSNLDNDLEEFKPERWFTDSDGGRASTAKEAAATAAEDDEFEIPTGSQTALFHPPRGAYIPFSEGPRSCIGRRFAQVEILATLAVLFHKHSIELCTDSYATEDEVRAMDAKARADVWGQAKREAERKIREEMGTVITLQMRGKGVKLRLCKRGEELFA